jgi:hypothetical protein
MENEGHEIITVNSCQWNSLWGCAVDWAESSNNSRQLQHIYMRTKRTGETRSTRALYLRSLDFKCEPKDQLPWRAIRVPTIAPEIWWVSISNYVTTNTFHVLSNSLFTNRAVTGTTQSQTLSLHEPETNKLIRQNVNTLFTIYTFP